MKHNNSYKSMFLVRMLTSFRLSDLLLLYINICVLINIELLLLCSSKASVGIESLSIRFLVSWKDRTVGLCSMIDLAELLRV